ncbi:hypothetical protein Q5752_003201 [Cryptotrichosporon argae]
MSSSAQPHNGQAADESSTLQRISDMFFQPADRPLVRDYHSINDPSILVRVPKKIETPVKVESKVWFANERTYIAYVTMGVLISTIALGLLAGAKDTLGKAFAGAYAVIAIGVLIYGYALYQHRITLISTRHAGNFDSPWGPVIITLVLAVAIAANFGTRVAEVRRATGEDPLSLARAWAVAGERSTWLNQRGVE